ncbi:MAG: CCA tRNA nucleotidyltransferase [SAR324 cluster bacterium]|uniref:CCA tRNA nucleotidyltransferase n=1 Tax=SAR324 cluster bacterium TaxID=2024889 RepID=A0A7X9FS10_9DELT|nr:CCA tRNA nucleotidyltransferase [SAR324 cluster bacterium]
MSEKPSSVGQKSVSPLQLDFLQTLDSLASKNSREVYVVGGFIRDILLDSLQSNKPDIDFVLEKDAEAFAIHAAKALKGKLRKHPAFLTFKVEAPEAFHLIPEFDIATARTEIYVCPGALPKIKPASIHDDLKRRDFTINSLAIRLGDLVAILQSEGCLDTLLKAKVLNYFNGLEDLESRLIRILHEKSFVDDPTRVFRACRYAARIGGEIESSTLEALKDSISHQSLQSISWFRILSELKKALSEKSPSDVFSLLDRCGILKALPCVAPDKIEDTRSALLRLARPLKKRQSELLFSTALRIFVYYSEEEPEPALFRAASLSKEQRESISQDIRKLRSATSLRGFSEEALLLGEAVEEDPEKRMEFSAALRRKGLLPDETGNVVVDDAN